MVTATMYWRVWQIDDFQRRMNTPRSQMTLDTLSNIIVSIISWLAEYKLTEKSSAIQTLLM